MLDQPNNTFPLTRSPTLRLALAFAALFALLLVARSWPSQTAAGVFLLMAASLARRLSSLRPVLVRRLIRFVVWISRRSRQSFGMTVEIESLLLATILLCIATLVLGLLAQPTPRPNTAMFAVAGGVMAVIGTVDLVQLAIRLLKFAWAKLIGKAALAGVAALAAWAANMSAGHLISQVTALDPKWFPDSKALLQLLGTPVYALLIGAGVILTIAFTTFIAMLVVLTFAEFVRLTLSLIPTWRPVRSAKASVAYRLAFGRNYQPGQKKPWIEWRPMASFLRPLATVAVCAFLLDVGMAPTRVDAPTLKRLASTTIASIDLHPIHKCSKLGPQTRVNYAAEGEVVWAEPAIDGWTFNHGKCE